MAGYTQAGTWLTDDNRVLIPQHTDNLGGFWYVNDDKAPGHLVRLPGEPPATSGDTAFQPGGQFTTPDPLNPGYFYRDAQNYYQPGQDISQTPGGGGALERIDAQGNVVGTYTHPNMPEQDEGGRGWDLNTLDAATGGPTSKSYPVEEGGLFGLGPIWGGLLGTALVLGGGFGLGALAGGVGAIGAGAGAAAAGAEGAGATGALASGATGLEALFGGGTAAAGAGAGAAAGAAGAAGTGGGLLSSLGGLFGGGGGAVGTLGGYAPLIGAGVSGLGNIIGSVIQGNAATRAAQQQADAARQASQLEYAMYQQNRADLAPYRAAGYGALQQLGSLVDQPLTLDAYTAQPVLQAKDYAFNTDQYAFDPSQYAFTPPSGQQVLNDDPGYQFRVSEGLKALDRQASAQGRLVSGGQLKGAQRFGQDLASQEYQAAYGRARDVNQMTYERGLTGNQLAYERGLQGNQLTYGRAQTQNEQEQQRALGQYQINTGNQLALRNMRYNELAGLSGTGQTAAAQTAQLGTNYANQAGQNTIGAANAQAAGTVGRANAYGSGFSSLGNAFNQYLNYNLLSSLYGGRGGGNTVSTGVSGGGYGLGGQIAYAPGYNASNAQPFAEGVSAGEDAMNQFWAV